MGDMEVGAVVGAPGTRGRAGRYPSLVPCSDPPCPVLSDGPRGTRTPGPLSHNPGRGRWNIGLATYAEFQVDFGVSCPVPARSRGAGAGVICVTPGVGGTGRLMAPLYPSLIYVPPVLPHPCCVVGGVTPPAVVCTPRVCTPDYEALHVLPLTLSTCIVCDLAGPLWLGVGRQVSVCTSTTGNQYFRWYSRGRTAAGTSS